MIVNEFHFAAWPEEDDVPEPELGGEPGVPQVHRRARRLRLPLLRLRPHPPGELKQPQISLQWPLRSREDSKDLSNN